jgi:hypothetical protein
MAMVNEIFDSNRHVGEKFRIHGTRQKDETNPDVISSHFILH